MDKQQLKQYEIDKADKIQEAIDKLPDAAFEILGAKAIVTYFDQAKISFDCENINQVFEKLHELKNRLGDYRIKSYWIPYEGCFCIDYDFSGTTVWFCLNKCNVIEAVSVFSNGKCRVVEENKQTIVCDI